MHIALIDLGTASVRFEVYAVLRRSDGHVIRERLHQERSMPRLGEGLYETRRLNVAAKEKLLQLFRHYKQKLEDWNVQHVFAVATSAIREADDAPEFITSLEEAGGFPVSIISGEEEASLIAKGILANESDLPAKFGLVDIGGGSTEISVCKNRNVDVSLSLPLGAIRSHQVYLKQSPPDKESTAALRNTIRQTLAVSGLAGSCPVSLLIGSSGTTRTLIGLEIQHSLPKGFLSRADLHALVKVMTPMNVQELRAIPGMEENRADILLAGAIVLEELADFLEADTIRATSFSLRHGLLEHAISALP